MMTTRALIPLLQSILLATAVYGDGGVTFTDIAADDGAGITYRRQRSVSDAIFDALKQQPTYTFPDIVATPLKSRGAPGVAILDFDSDGDQDLYVTNGPGAANSLYSNQLAETGAVSFVDVAVGAGVAATDQDSTGVCYGDLDNDGDPDLYVLGNKEPNRLFENQGADAAGTVSFLDITAASGLGGGLASSMSCTMGDVNGDGLLDVAVANTHDMIDQRAIFVVVFALNEPNQIFLNQGGNVFVDVSAASGLLNLDLPAEAPPDAATISWAIAMADLDLDGDIDLLQADDHAAVPGSIQGGIDRGYIQIFDNDGTGLFTNVTYEKGLGLAAGWMGLAFGDFDHNGRLDFFATNFGNHALVASRPGPPILRNRDSRWFLQQEDGNFEDSVSGEFINTPFGWGTSAADYDNDGDTDIVFHGATDLSIVVPTVPGVLLRNDGEGNFERDLAPLSSSTDHSRRDVHGMAVGDLDNDGFIDLVSVSNFDIPEPIVVEPGPFLGGDFDTGVGVLRTFFPVGPGVFAWSGLELPDGTLSVEISSGGNGNGWAQVEVLGTIGLTSGGRVNRDGIGAVVRFEPQNGQPVLQPILGGSSYASQDSLIAHFGLGQAQLGTVEVLWPGGVRNRLGPVHAGSRVLFPEIPCSFDDPASTFQEYRACVQTALDELTAAGVLETGDRGLFLSSAITAWQNAHPMP